MMLLQMVLITKGQEMYNRLRFVIWCSSRFIDRIVGVTCKLFSFVFMFFEIVNYRSKLEWSPATAVIISITAQCFSHIFVLTQSGCRTAISDCAYEFYCEASVVSFRLSQQGSRTIFRPQVEPQNSSSSNLNFRNNSYWATNQRSTGIFKSKFIHKVIQASNAY